MKSIFVEIPFCEESIYVKTACIKTALNMPAINAKFRTIAMFVTYLTDDITRITILIQNIGPVGH